MPADETYDERFYEQRRSRQRVSIEQNVGSRPLDAEGNQPAAAVVDSAAFLKRVLDMIPDPIVVLDDALRLLTGNLAAERTFGWTVEEAAALDLLELVHPDDVVTALTSATSVRGKDAGSLVEIRLRTRTEAFHTFEVRGQLTDDGDLRGMLLVLRDVTDRNRWDVHAGADVLHRSIVNSAPGITLLLDASGHLRGATRALTTLLQRPLEGLLGCHVQDVISPDTFGPVAEALRSSPTTSRTVEACFLDSDGDDIPVGLKLVDLRADSAVNGFIISAVDISEMSESRNELAYLAHHDPLTGVANRRRVMEILHDVLELDTVGGIIYCDIERFKPVNDRYGHNIGDQVLIEVASRLQAATRANDVVGRIGGDEFVIISADCPPEDLVALRRRIELLMYEPILLAGHSPVTITLTTGHHSFTSGDTADRVLDAADRMMYAAKHTSACRRCNGNCL